MRSRWVIILALTVVLVFAGCKWGSGSAQISTQKSEIDDTEEDLDDVYVIKERIQDKIWNEEPNHYYDLDEYDTLLNNGIFENVDYDSHDTAAWDTEKHLCYLKDMTLQFGKQKVSADSKMRNRILEGLDYWLDNQFQSRENWWFNKIKVPRDLLELGIMYDGYLSDNEILDIRKSTEGKTSLTEDLSWYQGTNLSDILNNAVMYGVLMGDKDLLNRVTKELKNDLAIRYDVKKTGIRPDMSFSTSHGGLCCGGAYGADYCLYMSKIISLFWNTKYSVDEANIELLVNHILEGENYFHMGTSTVYFSNGRHAVDDNGADNVKNAVDELVRLDGIYRQTELEKYRNSFQDNKYVSAGLKAFSDTYSLISKNENCYIGIKGANDGLALMNVQNGQGVLNYNLSYGSNTCFMHDGNEYSSIGAVLDFSMWPGITTYHETDEELYQRYVDDYGQTWGWGDYTQSEGRWTVTDCLDEAGIGLLSMNLLHDGITGALTYVSYGDGLIALGTDLICDKQDNDEEILTSVDQCKACMPVYSDKGLDSGEEVTVSKGQYVSNGGFSYYNLCDKGMIAANKVLTGSKSRGDSAGSDKIESRDVFQLWYPWGINLEGESYAYCVIDNMHLKDGQRQYTLPIEKITNTTEIQAVEFHDSHLAIIFHRDGSYTTCDGLEISGTEGEVVIR